MKSYIVVSAVGKDRPGFVNKVTQAIRACGGNVEIQRSTRMADEFALIMLVSLTGAAAGAIESLSALRTPDMFITARAALSPAEGAAPASLAQLEASGADQPGIIEAVTLLLFKHSINVESLDFDTESAPMSGEHLFRLTARLAIPAGVDVARLRASLRELESAYNFDVILRHPVS